jgi:hypothetical protein
MDLKPGSRWASAVCATEVVVVRSPTGDVDLRCGGVPMVAHGAERPQPVSIDPEFATGTQVGKRYVGLDGTLEMLCTKAGDGGLSVGAEVAQLKDAKPLPSSD